MSSLIDKDKSCEPSEGKKCKERKKHSEEVQRKDCVEPQPPPVVDKVLFDSVRYTNRYLSIYLGTYKEKDQLKALLGYCEKVVDVPGRGLGNT